MIPDTDFTLSASPPSSWSSWGSSSDAYINGSTINARLLLQTANPPSTTSNSAVGLVSPPLTQPLTKGKKYTLTWLANTSGSFTGFNYMFLLNTEDGNKMLTSADVERVETGLNAINTTATYSKYRITFESPVNGEANVLFGGLAEAGKYAYIYLTQPQLEKGELATSYNPANEDASERWSQLKITTDNITSEVGKKVGNDEIISRINQSSEKVSIDADKISLTAGSNLKLAVDNALRGGSAGVNLIGNTDFWINYDDFARTHTVSNTDETVRQSIILNTGFGKGWVRFKRADGDLSYMWTRRSGRNYFSITKGRTYTFSVLAATSWNNELNYVHIRGENSPDVTQTLHGSRSDVTTTRERIGRVNGRGVHKHTYTFKADFTTSRGLMIFGLNNSAETTAGFYLSEWKLEEGDVATPYQERLTGNNIISQINADETSMVISSSKVSIT